MDGVALGTQVPILDGTATDGGEINKARARAPVGGTESDSCLPRGASSSILIFLHVITFSCVYFKLHPDGEGP